MPSTKEAALWPSIQRWDDDHPSTSPSHLLPQPLPSPAWHWPLIFCSAKCHFIYISNKSKAASSQQSITAKLSNFPIHPQANWVKAFWGQLALYSACQIPSLCPTEHKEDQETIKNELHLVPLTATKIWQNVFPELLRPVPLLFRRDLRLVESQQPSFPSHT